MSEDNFDQLKALILAGPGGSGATGEGTEQRGPIGVPADYAFTTIPPPQGSFTESPGGPAGGTHLPEQYAQVTLSPPQRTAPRYFTGDEYLPAGYGPEDIWRLQTDLIIAGVLTADFRKGVWDQASRSAYSTVLGYANQTGTDWKVALNALASNPPIDPKTGLPAGTSERAPLTIRKTSDDDLMRILGAVAETTTGGGLTEADRQKFLRSYHAMEADSQRSAYNAQVSGGTVTATPDASVAAENQLRSDHPVESAGHDVANVFDQFLRLLGGPNGQG